MLIEQIWMGNALRNFNYLVACPESGEALAIDPLDHDVVLSAARRRGWTITQVLNTHEHGDHIAGNPGVIAHTGAPLLAPAAAGDSIPNVDTGLVEGDEVRVGASVVLKVIETPGHTMCHISLLHRAATPSLFCGDTLLNAGVGNCHNGGDPETLYRSFADKLFHLPDDTRIHPGHEYFETNLRFTLDREPGNRVAPKLLARAAECGPENAMITTLEIERSCNVFFRLGNPEVIKGVCASCPGFSDDPVPRELFIALRGLRDRW